MASANEKTEQTEAVKERQCTVRDLLSYAHLISSSYSNQMPANWSELDYRRPWPTDLGKFVQPLFFCLRSEVAVVTLSQHYPRQLIVK